jgi:hypothetical protein
MPSFNSAERPSIARQAAQISWSNTANRTARTQPARDAAERRFETQVDPDGVLDPQTRRQMAAAARRAFYTKIARASVASRRAAAASRKEARS